MQRDTESLIRQNTNVPAPDLSMDQAMNSIAEAGKQIIEQDQQAKIVNGLSQAKLSLTQSSQQYRADNIDDPLKGLQDLQEQHNQILQQYGENISPFFKRDWEGKAAELNTAQADSNELWAYKQLRENTAKNLNVSMQTNFQQANIDGQNFATGGGNIADALTSFSQSKQSLVDFGDKHIGSDKTGEILKSYDKDYMKAFVSGVAESNPQKAAALLNDPSVKGHFTTEERGELADQIQKTQKQMDLVKSLQTTQNGSAVMDIVNDKTDTYMNKRLKIDKMDLAGSITNEMASKARMVLNAQKDVDAVTDSGEMGGIVTQMYDLNAQSNMSNGEYLKGVQGIQNIILQKQAEGKLNQQDVIKMNDELRTMTSKRVADATKSFGNDMSDATDQFQALPAEYRGQATRQLFYATAGQRDKMTEDQYIQLSKTRAAYIVDQINVKRAADAQMVVNSVNAMQPQDVDLLRSKGYTLDDLSETAKKYKLTPQQVLQKLRDQKPAQQ